MPDVDANAMKSAVFLDVDGTLAKSTIVHYYVYLRENRLPFAIRPIWKAWFLSKCVAYYLLDYLDRSRLNTIFYRNYRGLPAEEIKAQAAQCHKQVIEPRLFAQALPCVARHRREGRVVVLVTGSIDFLMEPLADSLGAEEVLAPALLERQGRFTGELDGPPVGNEEKARRMEDYAKARHIDLAASYAYADSIADLPMLEMVGHPQVVNPDRRLRDLARVRHWPVHRWTLTASTTAEVA